MINRACWDGHEFCTGSTLFWGLSAAAKERLPPSRNRHKHISSTALPPPATAQ